MNKFISVSRRVIVYHFLFKVYRYSTSVSVFDTPKKCILIRPSVSVIHFLRVS